MFIASMKSTKTDLYNSNVHKQTMSIHVYCKQ